MVSLTTTATCDACFHQVSTGHATEAAMLAHLAGLGWQVGTDALLCPDCAADAVCAAVGCRFAPWRPCRCYGRLPGHGHAPAGSAAPERAGASVDPDTAPLVPGRGYDDMAAMLADIRTDAEAAECGVQFRWCERCSVHEERHPLDARSVGPALGEVCA